LFEITFNCSEVRSAIY